MFPYICLILSLTSFVFLRVWLFCLSCLLIYCCCIWNLYSLIIGSCLYFVQIDVSSKYRYKSINNFLVLMNICLPRYCNQMMFAEGKILVLFLAWWLVIGPQVSYENTNLLIKWDSVYLWLGLEAMQSFTCRQFSLRWLQTLLLMTLYLC